MYKIGNYLITKKFASGGEASLFLAKEPVRGDTVIIKKLHPHLVDDFTSLVNFIAGGEVAQFVEHPNVQKILEINADKNDNIPYIVMEFIPGYSLKHVIKTEKENGLFMPMHIASNIIYDVCKTILEIHKKDVIHRDIKPANVLLSSEGEVKLIDFGVAKSELFKEEPSDINHISGTIHYMAPELLNGVSGNLETDIWALGVLLYEMLTNEKPFTGNTDYVTIKKIKEGAFTPLQVYRDDTPDFLEDILYKMLAVNPEERFRNCSHILEKLEKQTRVIVKNRKYNIIRIYFRSLNLDNYWEST